MIILLSLCAAVVAAGEAPSSAGVVWDLPSVYPDNASWQADRERLMRGLAEAPRLAGKAGQSAQALAGVLDAVHDLRARAGKMARFAILNHEIDPASPENRARHDAATALEARVEEAVAFLARDVGGIGAVTLEKWQAAEPRLAPHRWRLFQLAAPSLEPQVESVLAGVGRWQQTTGDAAQELLRAELGWTRIALPSGGSARVDAESIVGLRRAPDATTRRTATRAYMARLQAFEEVFGVLATRRIEADLAEARFRNEPDYMDGALARSDRLAPGLIQPVLEAARAHSDLAARLAAALRRIGGTSDYGDFLYLPVPYQRKITVSQAKEIVVASVAPLGAAYQTRLRSRLEQPWMHLAPTPRKTSNVGVYWAVGGGHPYTMMTYRDDLSSSRLFASGAMLMMDYADLPDGFVPDLRSEDQPVHGNVIWTAARLFHDDFLLAHTTDRKERIALLVEGLRYLWRAFQESAIAVDLERTIAARVRAGHPMSGEEISRANLALLREYAADGRGGPSVTEDFARDWIPQPNLFYGHAHPVFVLCAVGAAALVEKVQAGDRKAIEGLSRGLSASAGSLYSADLLRAMGIDLGDPAVQQAIFRRMAAGLDALERELGDAGAGDAGHHRSD